MYEIKNNIVSPDIKDGLYRVKKVLGSRSNEQNRYLWGIVYKTIADFTGHSVDDLHAHFTREFLIEKVTLIKVYRSTTSLDKKEFGEYIERIKQWALNFNLIIPDPVDAPKYLNHVE